MKLKSVYYFFVGNRSRYSYWSCSTFADLLNKLFGMGKKPAAATLVEWAEYKAFNKKNHRFGEWVVETLLNRIQDTVMFPIDVSRNIQRIYVNRISDPTYILPTGLNRNDWHDPDSRITEALFLLLVQFVEIEKAADHRRVKPDSVGTPRELGLASLEWDILHNEGRHGAIAHQIKEIYLWICDVREQRMKPHELPEWIEYCETVGAGSDIFTHIRSRTAATKDKGKKIQQKMNKMTKAYADEDTEMLMKIVKLRKDLS